MTYNIITPKTIAVLLSLLLVIIAINAIWELFTGGLANAQQTANDAITIQDNLRR